MPSVVPHLGACVVAIGTTLIAVAEAEPVGASRAAAVCATSSTETLPVARARLLRVGNYRGPTASANADAQRFFDQGLVFGWGFNFAEAVRSFRAAAQLDPQCGLCRWGIAWALGPSINHDMRPEDVPMALDAVLQARAAAAPGSLEKELVEALAVRYSARPGADVAQRASSYAAAMRVLAERYTDDPDIAVWAAEAAMNAHPYDYWRADGRPQSWTPQIIAWLDQALTLAPAHPGAHHYRIHLFEDSPHPERVLASAEQLGGLAPVVGHLVHMPSHIFFRLGRYREAMIANDSAVKADREYAAAAEAQSDYALHNLHYLWVAALWNNDSDTSIRAAHELAAAAAGPADAAEDGTRQHLRAAPALTDVRLRRWKTRRTAAEDGMYLQGLTQFSNGMAGAALGDLPGARADLEALRGSIRAVQRAGLRIKNVHRAADVLEVARSQLQSAISTARGRHGEAVHFARAAVTAESRLSDDDPPVWPLPARHTLGAALLRADRAREARTVFLADLQRYPQNCTALAGIAAAERQRYSSLSASRDSSARVSAPSHCPE